jgi:AcrR family transcriptional regulator
MSSPARQDNKYHHGALREALLHHAAEVIESDGIEALTLRGLARDLGVSHAAPNRHFRNKEELLASLAATAYQQMCAATLGAAELAGDDPWVRLNAMGRGYLKWALQNRALFMTVLHPDLSRFVDENLAEEIATFQATVRQACDAAQAAGRYPDVDPNILTLYTNAVPFGATTLLTHPTFSAEAENRDIDELVAAVIELVVPIKNRNA